VASIGATPELVIGIAAGAAASAALEPALEIPKQDAWNNARNRILVPGELARLVAMGGVDLDTAHYYAHRQGFDDDQFAGLVYMAQTVPDFALALDIWRRHPEDKDLFTHALVHSGLDQRYIDILLTYDANELLSAADLAYMVVRGVMDDQGMLGMTLPTQPDNLQLPPMSQIDAVKEAARSGWSKDRLSALVARSGLAMAPVMAAQANFRTNANATLANLPPIPGITPLPNTVILTDTDYEITIARGDLYPAYADPVKEASRQILTAGEYAELQLRGYITAEQRRALTHQHGMRAGDSDLLYDVLGRAPSIRQAYIGLARGAKYDGGPQDIPSPYLEAAQRSNLRPEWYSIAYENRYSLPSAFVTRALLTDGAISEQRGEEIFLHSGWPPDLAALVANHYAGGTGTTTDKHVTSAQTQLWTTTHTAYKNGEIDWAEAAQNLTALGISAADQNAIKTLWDAERDTYRKQLTPTQIKKAWKGAVVNPATGVAWTKDDALAALIGRGYSPNDANTFLEL